jgi:hypothetical protein
MARRTSFTTMILIVAVAATVAVALFILVPPTIWQSLSLTDGFSAAATAAPAKLAVALPAPEYRSSLIACRSPNPAVGTLCTEGTFCDSVTSECQRVTAAGSTDPIGYYS